MPVYRLLWLSPCLFTSPLGPVAPQCRVVERCIRAPVVTSTRVNHHHSSLQPPAARTLEGDLIGGGVRRCTAAGICAESTVAQLVGPSAVAALVNQVSGARGRVAGLTLTSLPPLEKQNTQFVESTQSDKRREFLWGNQGRHVRAKVFSCPSLPVLES